MARLPQPGLDNNVWGDILNEFLSVAHNADGTVKASSIATLSRSISSVASNTTAGSAALTDYVYLATGGITITLPAAADNTNCYTITNVGNNTVTVATTSGQTILGSNNATLPLTNMSLTFVSDGSNWTIA